MLWDAYLLAKRTGSRPSECFFIKDELAAWCFDRAVMAFGADVIADLDTIEHKNAKTLEHKRQARLEKWLDMAPKFRDPVAAAK